MSLSSCIRKGGGGGRECLLELGVEAKQPHNQRKVTQKKHKKAQSIQERMLRLWPASEWKMRKREKKEKCSFLCEDSKKLGTSQSQSKDAGKEKSFSLKGQLSFRFFGVVLHESALLKGGLLVGWLICLSRLILMFGVAWNNRSLPSRKECSLNGLQCCYSEVEMLFCSFIHLSKVFHQVPYIPTTSRSKQCESQCRWREECGKQRKLMLHRSLIPLENSEEGEIKYQV